MKALPPEAARRIAASLDAARLRRREREDVAAELAAHFEDGIENGRDLEGLLEAFGDPHAAGSLIGRSVRRRHAGRQPVFLAAMTATLALAGVYTVFFARLHAGSPERRFASPSAAAAAWRTAPSNSEAAAFDGVLAAMYTEGEDGRLTAEGLRAFQAWKGKVDPGLWSIALEPAFFPNAARRGDVRREFERFVRLAEDPSGRFEAERAALLADGRRARCYVALQIPLQRLAAARAAASTSP